MSILNIYTTPPQKEHKALGDCRRARIKAALPRSKMPKVSFGRSSRPLTPGYVFAEAKPADTPYMRCKPDGKPIGTVTRAEISKLWIHARARPTKPAHGRKFAIGDRVSIKVGPFADLTAIVAGDTGKRYLVEVELMKKIHSIEVQERHLRRRIDPG